MSFIGDEKLSSDFTTAQAVAVEAALRCAPQQFRGGLLRMLAVELGASPWSDAQVSAGLVATFEAQNLASPILDLS